MSRSQNSPGYASLFEAVRYGTIDAVRDMIAKGADVNAKDRAGCTALMYAAEHGSADAVMALIAEGADPAAKDGSGRTASDHARRNERLKGTGALRALEKGSHGQTGGAGILTS